jgi:CitMHS family citrate-Mg2+:H+ or citrate-Ca2+:H+ symporter
MSIFRPMIPVQLAGLAFVFGSAWWLGRREAKRLGFKARKLDEAFQRELDAGERALRRPGRFWVNLVLTLILITGMILARLDPVVVFMVGLVLALWVNYPDLKEQRERLDAHSRAALLMVGVLFAAGAFTGILKESGMLDAMTRSAIAFAPPRLAPHLPFALGLLSMPSILTPSTLGWCPCWLTPAAPLESRRSRLPKPPCSAK